MLSKSTFWLSSGSAGVTLHRLTGRDKPSTTWGRLRHIKTRRRKAGPHARWRGAYGECSGNVGGQKEGHRGLGTCRGLSHLDLTGLRGRVTTGHAASRPRRPEKQTQPFFSSARVFPHARLPGVLNQHLPDSDYSTLAVVAAFIHSAVSGAIARVAFLWVCIVKKKIKGERKTKPGAFGERKCGGLNAPNEFKLSQFAASAR